MKKLLFITNISGKRMNGAFCSAAVSACKELDISMLHVANRSESNQEDIKADEDEYGIELFNAPISRSPFSKSNIEAYNQIVKIIKDEKIDYIHCNTPVGGLIGRLAGKKCNVKKVIYQVHGFHFYKGAPKKNWMIFYPIEKWLAHKTDALVTINTEDYELAEKFKLRNNGKKYYVHGVGIDTVICKNTIDREEKRQEIGLQNKDFAFVIAGRIEKNKNNIALINALGKTENKNIKLVFCGEGEEKESLEALAKELNVSERVFFLGNRDDMPEIYSAVDGLCLASFREGLSRTIMEAMSYGLPCVVSKIRGNVDLIDNEKGGFLCLPSNYNDFAKSMDRISIDKELQKSMSKYNKEKVKQFDSSVVNAEMLKIYKEVFGY